MDTSYPRAFASFISQIRTLLAKSDDWDHDAWGIPISSAHLGFAISVFSKRLLNYSMLVGADFNEGRKSECSQYLALQRLSHGDT